METVIQTLQELDVFAAQQCAMILSRAKESAPTAATVLGLSGELGAGKTAFTQAFARALGVRESVTSPTFVIARFYSLKPQGVFTRLVHVDAYRILDMAELDAIGWEDILRDARNLVVVEWPEQMGSRFPSYAALVRFGVGDGGVRSIVHNN